MGRVDKEAGRQVDKERVFGERGGCSPTWGGWRIKWQICRLIEASGERNLRQICRKLRLLRYGVDGSGSDGDGRLGEVPEEGELGSAAVIDGLRAALGLGDVGHQLAEQGQLAQLWQAQQSVQLQSPRQP